MMRNGVTSVVKRNPKDWRWFYVTRKRENICIFVMHYC
uniref:Uncharacterized protein n=1 Tax=Arundo donax TaxID=35708 RepID=A0A0A9CN81_ARUDO